MKGVSGSVDTSQGGRRHYRRGSYGYGYPYYGYGYYRPYFGYGYRPYGYYGYGRRWGY
jgi:hypothetical protein